MIGRLLFFFYYHRSLLLYHSMLWFQRGGGTWSWILLPQLEIHYSLVRLQSQPPWLMSCKVKLWHIVNNPRDVTVHPALLFLTTLGRMPRGGLLVSIHPRLSLSRERYGGPSTAFKRRVEGNAPQYPPIPPMIQLTAERENKHLREIYSSLECDTKAISVWEIGRHEKNSAARPRAPHTEVMHLAFMGLLLLRSCLVFLLKNTRTSRGLWRQGDTFLLYLA